jgi:DNA-binding response OmpR family regulator
MPPPDIIIIEDDPLVGEIARDILTRQGYAVQLLPESRDAIAAITAAMPKLVITDIMMPGLSGLDICNAVKSDPAIAHVKIMVMSAKSFEVEKKRAIQFGALAFLTKPFDEKTLIMIVKRLINSPGPEQGRK